MGKMIINNKSFVGNSIIIENNKIIIDGVDQTPDAKIVTISVDGDIQSLEVDNCQQINVTGNCQNISTVNADVKCGDVQNNVSTVNGDVDCKIVKGSVSTVNGDISKN